MAFLLGSTFPNVEVNTTHGKFKLHDYQGDSWLVFLSHPADFTPVCTTELGRAASTVEDFRSRNVKLIALSCDVVETHVAWSTDVMAFINRLDEELPYPIIADKSRALAVRFGMLDPLAKDNEGIPLTCRAVFIIDPKKVNESSHMVTPVDWNVGDRVIVPKTVSSTECPNDVETIKLPSGKEYLRYASLKKD